MASKQALVLASGSPRRKQLLASVGINAHIIVPDIDETHHAGEIAEDYVKRLSLAKAKTVGESLETSAIVLAADTTVVAKPEMGASDQREVLLHKPASFSEAQTMWRLLSGRSHRVITGVALFTKQRSHVVSVTTHVDFKSLSDDEMWAYWHTGEPRDKAGGYAVQGLASAWVTRINGSFSNVVGLPLFETNQLLARYALNWI